MEMRHVYIADEEAQLVERAAAMGKVSQLIELLKLAEEKGVSIDQLLEDIKGREPSPVEPRVKEIEDKLSELEPRVTEIESKPFEWEPRVKEIEGKLLELELNVDEIDNRLRTLTNLAIWKRDRCEHYDGTKCTNWFWLEDPPKIFKTVKDEKGWRVVVKEHPEYCAACAAFIKKEKE